MDIKLKIKNILDAVCNRTIKVKDGVKDMFLKEYYNKAYVDEIRKQIKEELNCSPEDDKARRRHNVISKRAYLKWVNAGKPEGCSEHFWNQASQEVDEFINLFEE